MAIPDTDAYPVTMTDEIGHDYPVFDASGYVNSVYSLGHRAKGSGEQLTPPPAPETPAFDTPDTPVDSPVFSSDYDEEPELIEGA